MDALSSDIRVADMIDDRSADGIFRVDRDIYLNPEVFEAELKAILSPIGFFSVMKVRLRNRVTILQLILVGNQCSFIVRKTGASKGF